MYAQSETASMNSSAAAEADLETAACDDTRIRDQVQQPAADILGLNPRLGSGISLHHAADQVVRNVLAARRLHHRRVHGGRAVDVDGDALLGNFQGQGLREPDDSPFSCVVCRQLWNAHAAAHRGRDDNPAETLPPHHLYRGTQSMKCARQIGVHQLVPDLVGHLFQGSGADDPGVGRHNVETAQPVYRFLNGCGRRGGVAHIHRDRKAEAAQRLDLIGRVAKIILGAEQVNGDEMASVIENHFTMNSKTLKTHSIETFAWDAAGDLLIKTYYDMPADIGDGDDPYEFLLGKDNVIANE